MRIQRALLLILVAALTGCIRSHKEQLLQEDLALMRHAIDNFAQKEGRSPESLDELVSRKYINSIPVDPFTGSSSSWTVEREGAAIFDVHSGSHATGSNGKPYIQW